MNLPNKLTLLRMILVPFFVAFLLISQIPFNTIWALLIFIVASLTDFFDGRYARKYKMITDFGKFADPLADKILVISAFCCFVQMDIMHCVPLIIILFREFAVTSVRLVSASQGKVVSANIFGKIKTVSQIIAIIIMILNLVIVQLFGKDIVPEIVFTVINEVVVWISVLFTVISGIIYLKDNADVYKTMK